jgi:hypothetical protein
MRSTDAEVEAANRKRERGNLIRLRHIVPPLLLLLAFAATAEAQEAFRASWVIQDRVHGLTQPFASSLIARANDWLTREDASAPTARLDDPVRVTVVGEVLSPGGLVRTRLARLVLGTIVIDGQFEQFLDTATIASIIRRDHFWRDESYVVVNESAAPRYAESIASRPAHYHDALEEESPVSRVRLALDESSVRFGDELSIWSGIGFEELGLPDFSYGKVRAGITYGRMRAWGEAPLPVGSIDNPVFARGLTGTFGAGVGFRSESLEGAVTWGDPLSDDSTQSQSNSTTYKLDRAALFQVKVLTADLPFMDGSLHLKLGTAYRHVTMRTHSSADAPDIERGVDRVLPLVRAEFASHSSETGGRSLVTAEVMMDSFIGTYVGEFNRTFGVRLALAAHGLLGDRDPFLPQFSITLSPTITF